MKFGILFTSHPNTDREPYPHRDVHARVTREIVRAHQAGGIEQRLGAPVPGAEFRGAAQPAVVDRRKAFDEPRFLDQGAELTGGLDPVDPLHLLRDLHVPRIAMIARKMRQYPRAQVDALPHVQRGAVLAIKEIDAGHFRDVVEGALRESRRNGGCPDEGIDRGGDRARGNLTAPLLQEQPYGARVAERAVARVARKAVTLHERIEIVARFPREEPA